MENACNGAWPTHPMPAVCYIFGSTLETSLRTKRTEFDSSSNFQKPENSLQEQLIAVLVYNLLAVPEHLRGHVI